MNWYIRKKKRKKSKENTRPFLLQLPNSTTNAVTCTWELAGMRIQKHWPMEGEEPVLH
jgi:hypothetical protein